MPGVWRMAALVASVMVPGLLGGEASAASVTPRKAIWGPAERAGVSQFPLYRELGAGIWQTDLRWADIAPSRPARPRDPSDPAYRWPAGLDAAIASAGREGIRVMVALTGSPRWANGGRSPAWAPTKPQDFAAFAAAASRRYPGVSAWLIWGEPTKRANFRPLPRAPGSTRLRGDQLAGPRRYARILDASFAALKRADPGDRVIGGNSFTVGDVTPLAWIRALRLPGGRPPRMDLYGHNPFSARRPQLDAPPLGRGLADFSDLDTLAGWLDGNLRGNGNGRLRLYLSEFTIPTDHPNRDFNFYVTRAVQADWLRAALRITRRSSRIATLGWLSLYDQPSVPAGDEVRYGLLDEDGRRKPAFAVFANG